MQMPETLVDAKVTYTVEYDGQVYIVEHVPAKVSQETGEQYFAPETVERIRALIKSRRKPDKVIETPVYEFA
jgi:YgiT-type zinc finger domain-containing protein